MALKHYAATAIVLGCASWLWVTGSQRADAARRVVASQHRLGEQQMIVYDRCIGAMRHKRLRAGGSNQEFCGCLVQSGFGELQPDESNAVLGWIEHGIPTSAMVTDRQDRALTAAMTCSEDTRGRWTSVAAMQSWCAEKDARSSLPQCRLGLK